MARNIQIVAKLALALLCAQPVIAAPPMLWFKCRVVVDRGGTTEYVYIQARDSIAARKLAEAQYGKGNVRDVVREYGH